MDEENRVYIYYTLDEAQEQLCCKTDKAVKLFAELDEGKGIGLIERIRQGQGRPAKIYVKRFVLNTEVKTSEKPKSRPRENRNQDSGKTEVQTSKKPRSRLLEDRSADFGFSERNNTENTIMPEEDNTKYFIISLIVQQLYREILSVADEYGGKLPNRVMGVAILAVLNAMRAMNMKNL